MWIKTLKLIPLRRIYLKEIEMGTFSYYSVSVTVLFIVANMDTCSRRTSGEWIITLLVRWYRRWTKAQRHYKVPFLSRRYAYGVTLGGEEKRYN